MYSIRYCSCCMKINVFIANDALEGVCIYNALLKVASQIIGEDVFNVREVEDVASECDWQAKSENAVESGDEVATDVLLSARANWVPVTIVVS